MYVITNFFNTAFRVLSGTHMVTSLGVCMRYPMQKDGTWIGWTDKEIKDHLDSVKKYEKTLPPKPKENGRGC